VPLALRGKVAPLELLLASTFTFVLQVEAELRLVSRAAVETVGDRAGQDLPNAPEEVDFPHALRG